ncbi:flavin-containing monooxygenase [Gordonia tangerina]|jgi:cation diffusion facilitator CzcD-associated flavoprotein CzcO|uniref:NAD(P)/FAD-dependent oxidoreductase n=1 Tax=Gordonia tangerina TaxID=2911060 RepID=A0ABS9DP44_9ACTN|nr:NAD(P)/FAD-dependent oxidoreductase [Gordonia tangerina]MCF3940985.1 NAD(P)/FAD-dependent oxidoreductase [Gordonia tangerina]
MPSDPTPIHRCDRLPDRVDVLVVGAGFGGLAALHRLSVDHPDLNVLAVERAEGAGGVWRANDYPGAACDVPTSLYSLSFAPNPDWSHTYGRQHEIRDYLVGVAAQFDDRIRYRCALLDAQWDDAAGEWSVTTELGGLRCRFLVAAPGALSAPGVPDLPGSETFDGHVFHSARWDHEHTLWGRRVGIVGSGASAVQIVPEIVDEVEHLVVFQRTPAWVVPRLDRRIGQAEQELYRRIPASHRLMRRMVHLYRESYVIMMARRPELLPIAMAMGKAQLRLQVRDRTLRQRLTPRYTIGCKRMLLTNKWFPALQRPNVTVTGALTALSDGGAIDDSGTTHEVDTLIYATGFTPTEPPIAQHIRGRTGATLAETWAGSPSAYRGVSIHGFPNLFFLYGPNTNLGHSSIVLMLEPQARYVSTTIAHLRTAGIDTVEVRADAQHQYNSHLDDELAGTVWNTGGCASWYIDSSGRNSVMWPTFTNTYRRLMSHFEPLDHRLGRRHGATAGQSAREAEVGR